MKPLVYIAGPLTHGDRTDNLRAALKAADLVVDAGGVPFVPHLLDTWNLLTPRSYEDWMAIDFEFVRRADILWRIPGLSPGADREFVFACDNGVRAVASESAMRKAVEEMTRR